jgi:hypothetical protein
MKRVLSLSVLVLAAATLMGQASPAAGCFGVPTLPGSAGAAGSSASAVTDGVCNYATFVATDGRACEEFKGFLAGSLEFNSTLCTTGQGVWESNKSCDRAGALGACRTTTSTGGAQTQWYYATAAMREMKDLPCYTGNGTTSNVAVLDATGNVYDTDTNDNIPASCAYVETNEDTQTGAIVTWTRCTDYLGVWTRPARDQERTHVCVGSTNGKHSLVATWSEGPCNRGSYTAGCKATSYGGYGVGTFAAGWYGSGYTALNVKAECEMAGNTYLTP